MSFETEGVEFVNGPLDGLFQFVDTPLSELESVLGVLINRNIVQTLTGLPPQFDELATSVAIYKLNDAGPTARYIHLGSVHPSQIELTDRAH